jgi:hypothetical protein
MHRPRSSAWSAYYAREACIKRPLVAAELRGFVRCLGLFPALLAPPQFIDLDVAQFVWSQAAT